MQVGSVTEMKRWLLDPIYIFTKGVMARERMEFAIWAIEFRLTGEFG